MIVYGLYYAQDEFEPTTLLDLYAKKEDAEREAARGMERAEHSERYWVREWTVKLGAAK